MGLVEDQRARAALRTATADDLPDLVRLAHAFYDEDGFTASEEDVRIRFEDLLASPEAQIVVANRDNAACAFALTTVRLILESGLVAEIQDLYVKPGHRRQGIAQALIEDAAAWARGRSASLLEVVVAPNGREVAQLLSYYASRGFVDEGRRIFSRAL